MFCNRDNYYRGYSKGLTEGLSNKNGNFYSNVLNTSIAIATIAAAMFTYKNWQDTRYIYRLDNIIEAYYETFIPSAAADSIPMDMYYTYKIVMKGMDVNEVAKASNFSMDFPLSTNFNKLKEQKGDFYTNEILIKIKNAMPNSYRLIASLEKIKPFLSHKLREKIDDFIAEIKLTEFYLYEAKITPQNIEQPILNLFQQINEQNDNFIKLIDEIRRYLNI